jgi:hypothetical protein
VLNGTSPNLTYTPAPNYYGPDSFTFKVSDGEHDSAVATITITVRSVNDAPLARGAVYPVLHLGPDLDRQLVLAINNSNATVVLDGSLSSDAEGDPLEYLWAENGQLLPAPSGERVTNTFELGRHVVTLTVGDGAAAGTASVSFEVVTPSEAVDILLDLLASEGLSRREVRPLLATLRAASAAFDRGLWQTGLNILGAFENKVQAQLQSSRPALCGELLTMTDRIVERLRDAP